MKVIDPKLKFTKPLIPLDPNRVEFIFIHHPMAKSATIEDIHQWHLSKGWNGAGYNSYIRKDGTIYIGRGNNIGAHVHGHNSRSYGICVEGDYRTDKEPTDELYTIIAKHILDVQKRFPKAQAILPHSARQSTQCPGDNFSMGRLYAKITELIKKEVDVMDLKKAIAILADKKIINTPSYWDGACKYVKWLEDLIINVAVYINK